MKVILQKDVKAQGREGDVVTVSDGYARNYLIPRGLAKEATPQNIRELNTKKEAIERKRLLEADNAKELAKHIETITITLKAKAGAGQKLFGSITSKDVAEGLLAQAKIEIDKKKLELDEGGIKTLGEHTVKVSLHTGISSKFKVVVLAE